MTNRVSEQIPAYAYGSPELAASPVTLDDLHALKTSIGFTAEDERLLKMAGEVLTSQTQQIVAHWRSGIIANIPNLARHSRTPENEPNPAYLAASNLRFEQWILDTCLRSYDQEWLNYQQEIALRHTSLKKNQADGVRSTPFVPFRDVTSFTVVMNETIKPYLRKNGHSDVDVDAMHLAWTKSLQMQTALWAKPYMDLASTKTEW